MPQKTVKKAAQPQAQSGRDFGQQVLGGVIGALVVGLVLQLGPMVGWEPVNRLSWMLLGATIGAVLFSLDRFDMAGARLTRRKEARVLNIIVGVLGMIVLTGIVWSLIVFVSWVWQQLF